MIHRRQILGLASRIEVLGLDNQPVGYFFTSKPVSECRGLSPVDFADIPGEWVPAGGIRYEESGELAWYRQPVTIGEVVAVGG